jgi:hypothetical protein
MYTGGLAFVDRLVFMSGKVLAHWLKLDSPSMAFSVPLRATEDSSVNPFRVLLVLRGGSEVDFGSNFAAKFERLLAAVNSDAPGISTNALAMELTSSTNGGLGSMPSEENPRLRAQG